MNYQQEVLTAKERNRLHQIANEHAENMTVVGCKNVKGTAIPTRLRIPRWFTSKVANEDDAKKKHDDRNFYSFLTIWINTEHKGFVSLLMM